MTLPWQNVCLILFSLRILQNLILKNAALNKDSITTGILVHPTDTFVNRSFTHCTCITVFQPKFWIVISVYVVFPMSLIEQGKNQLVNLK